MSAVVQRAGAWRIALSGWRRLGAAFTLGAVSVLAMPPFELWPIWFVTFPALVLLLDTANRAPPLPGLPPTATQSGASKRQSDPHQALPRQPLDTGEEQPAQLAELGAAPTHRNRALTAGLIGWWFGFGYLFFGLYWIGSAFLVRAGGFVVLMPLAITALPAYLALYFAAAAAAASLFWQPGPTRLVTLAITLTASEWLRGHWFTGFPWNALGYGLTINPALAQTAALVGVTGLNFWAVLLFSSPALLINDNGKPVLNLVCFPLAILGMCLALGWGDGRLATAPDNGSSGVRIRLVQPNIPETDKFKPGSQRPIFDRMIDLSRRNGQNRVDDLAATDVLIWPEEPLNFLVLDTPQALNEISAMLGGHTTLITGAFRAEATQNGGRRVFNSLAVIDPSGKPQGVFDKIHLVPWGEYLPYQSWLEAIGLESLAGNNDEPGTNARALEAPGVPAFSPLICYEAIFPGEAVAPGTQPQWLLNVTNDAWFGDQTGPYQHFHQARIRAIEEGLPLVRAAITGISAVVDAQGRVLQSLPLLQAGVIDAVLPARRPDTPYARYGDKIMVLQLLIALAFIAVLQRKRIIARG